MQLRLFSPAAASRVAMYVGGLAVTALGIAIVIESGVGAGPWDTVAVGLHRLCGATVGTWSIATQLLIVLFTWFIGGGALSWGSVVAIVIRSLFLDLWLDLLPRLAGVSLYWAVQWMSFAAGVVLLGVGVGIYIEANLPKTPVDGLMLALRQKFGWSLTLSRTVIESFAVIAGLLLGGPVGLGTVLVAFVLGRVIFVSNRLIRKVCGVARETASMKSL